MFESPILRYIFIGLLFLVMIEVLTSRAETKLLWYERIIIAAIWPISLVIFILAFLYGVYDQLKKNLKK